MSVTITIRDAVKIFGDRTVIPNLNVDIRPGEFFTLLGSSGCGKTTLLRMIAGFNSIEGGDILFNEKRINEIPPHKRNIGMVFQNYAIFPHMTAGENVAFGLKNRKLQKAEIANRVAELMEVTHIEDYKDQLPSKMSGGQQQRIALARAIVVQPDVLLMDEPLSNLDAKLRVEMRTAIKDIQRKFKITTVYVTHDQEEALAISDRIAVMKDGIIQQIGAPIEIYQRPRNVFVAQFIGQSNLLPGHIKKQSAQGGVILDNGAFIQMTTLGREATDGQKVWLLCRPSEFAIASEGQLSAKVLSNTFLGQYMQYVMALDNGQTIEVFEYNLSRPIYQEGAIISLQIKPPVLNVYDQESGQSLLEGVEVSG